MKKARKLRYLRNYYSQLLRQCKFRYYQYLLNKACERIANQVYTFCPFSTFQNLREPLKPMVYWFRLEKGSALGVHLPYDGLDSTQSASSAAIYKRSSTSHVQPQFSINCKEVNIHADTNAFVNTKANTDQNIYRTMD